MGHPDISDLFLEPQEQSSAEYYRSTLKYGEDLGRDDDSRIIHSYSKNAISGGLLTADETSNSVVGHLQPPYPVSDDTHVSMDDLFG